MQIKRGSVTPVDLTGQASGDYLRNDGGIWKPKPISDTVRKISLEPTCVDFPLTSILTISTIVGTGAVGTGTSAPGARSMNITTGGTAGSSILYVSERNPGYSIGQYASVVSWNRVILSMRIQDRTNTATMYNVFKWWAGFGWGASATIDTIGNPQRKSIGIMVENNNISGTTHNGTTFTETSFTQATADALVDFLIDCNAGTVDYYVNGVLRGTTAGGPTGNSGIGDARFYWGITNGTQATAFTAILNSMKLYVGA
jgi:hypothetical protein